MLLSDQMWLWARGYDGGGPYLDLLRRLAHWLMKEPDLEEEALRASAKGREVTVERQSVSGEERETDLVAPGRHEDEARLDAVRAGPQPGACRRSTASAFIAPRTAHMSRWSTSAPRIRSKCRTSSRLRKSCARSPRRPAARCAASAAGRRRRNRSPRVVGLNPAPSYGGGDYIGVKRTGSSELIGARSTSLASGFFGLALLLGMVIIAWVSESGRLRRGAGSEQPPADRGESAESECATRRIAEQEIGEEPGVSRVGVDGQREHDVERSARPEHAKVDRVIAELRDRVDRRRQDVRRRCRSAVRLMPVTPLASTSSPL